MVNFLPVSIDFFAVEGYFFGVKEVLFNKSYLILR